MSEEKPPIGLVPKWKVQEDRLKALCQAVVRYLEDNRSIPAEWLEELEELSGAINRGRSP